jgi:hypothetical protein
VALEQPHYGEGHLRALQSGSVAAMLAAAAAAVVVATGLGCKVAADWVGTPDGCDSTLAVVEAVGKAHMEVLGSAAVAAAAAAVASASGAAVGDKP